MSDSQGKRDPKDLLDSIISMIADTRRILEEAREPEVDILAPRPEGYKYPTPPPTLPSLDKMDGPRLEQLMLMLHGTLLCYMDNNQFDEAKVVAGHLKQVIAAGRAWVDANPCNCPNCTAKRAAKDAPAQADEVIAKAMRVAGKLQ